MGFLRIFFVGFVLFASSVALDDIENGFATQANDPKVVKIAVIDTKKARELFQEFARHKDIPFRYPIDGCYARATEMSRIAENQGIQLGKVYAEGLLQVKTESSMYPIVRWGWHVAPVAYVKDESGATDIVVFDPSLFKEPVPVRDWVKKMMDQTGGTKPNARVYFGARYQYYPVSSEGNKASWSDGDLKHVQSTFENYRPLEDKNAPAVGAQQTPKDSQVPPKQGVQ